MQDRLRVLLLNWRDSGHPEGGGRRELLRAGGQRAGGARARRHRAVRPLPRRGGGRDRRRGGVRAARRPVHRLPAGGAGAGPAAARVRRGARRAERDAVLGAAVHPGAGRQRDPPPAPGAVDRGLRRRRSAGSAGGWSPGWRRGSTGAAATSPSPRPPGPTWSRSASTPERVGVVYSGLDAPVLPVDAAAWPRSPQPSVVVLGRLVPHKRVELAIDAVAALPGRDAHRRRARLLGAAAARVRRAARRRRRGDVRRVRGRRDQAPAARRGLGARAAVGEGGLEPRGGGERGARHADGRVPVRRRPDRVRPGRGDRAARRRR